MALNFTKIPFGASFSPTAAIPLNARCYFESMEKAEAAAKLAVEAGNPRGKYYFGQPLIVADLKNRQVHLVQITTERTLKVYGDGGGIGTGITAIKLHETPLTVNDGVVTIPLAQAETPGVVLSTEKENGVRVEAGGEMYVHSLNVSKLVQNEGEVLVLRGKIYDKE